MELNYYSMEGFPNGDQRLKAGVGYRGFPKLE